MHATRSLGLAAVLALSLIAPSVGVATADRQQQTTSSPLSEMEEAGRPRTPT
ncbi:hypothetical protein ACFQL4_19220 [Halosimplex aquaticum]